MRCRAMSTSLCCRGPRACPGARGRRPAAPSARRRFSFLTLSSFSSIVVGDLLVERGDTGRGRPSRPARPCSTSLTYSSISTSVASSTLLANLTGVVALELACCPGCLSRCVLELLERDACRRPASGTPCAGPAAPSASASASAARRPSSASSGGELACRRPACSSFSSRSLDLGDDGRVGGQDEVVGAGRRGRSGSGPSRRPSCRACGPARGSSLSRYLASSSTVIRPSGS